MSFNNTTLNKTSSKMFLPVHGGALNAAAEFFNIPNEQWLDISTGINPTSWPVPEVPSRVWQRLPEEQKGSGESLEQTALGHYLNNTKLKTNDNTQTESPVTRDNVLSCAGSQQGIRLLPFLYAASQHGRKTEAKVWVTSGSYAEHGIAWEEQGHRVCKVACDKISELLSQQPVDVLILLNPDNPSGHRWPAEQLLKWWSILHRRGGWLIVDEAFMDMTPEHSIAGSVEREGLFVLRSLGKFFGLAGLRLGFVLAAEKNIKRLNKMLGPWVVSHPAQYLGKLALQDEAWVNKQRYELAQQSLRLASLLEQHIRCQCDGTDLFQTVYHKKSESLFNQLAQQGILVRFLPETSKTSTGLRFGLPSNDEKSWLRLDEALSQLVL
ncbi:MAG: threonine-phosphate decarboxylase [Oleispira sp.]